MGVFGGQFDPPHAGHVAIVRTARGQLELDEVLVLPDGPAPHRPSGLLPAETRFRLAEAALAGEQGVIVSGMALEPGAPVYMADKLELLAGDDRRLFLLIGADQLAAFPDWHRPERVRELATLAVAPRTGLAIAGPGVVELDMPPVDVSSTELRDALERGEDVGDLIPAPALALIERERLYH